MKTKTLHAITAVLKLLSILLVLIPTLNGQDGNLPAYGVMLFTVTSFLKDLLLFIGDWLDDGIRNGSFKVPLVILAFTVLCFILPGCAFDGLSEITYVEPNGTLYHVGKDGIRVEQKTQTTPPALATAPVRVAPAK